jgi:hypothetical protein
LILISETEFPFVNIHERWPLTSHVNDKQQGCELYIKVTLWGFIVAGAFECGNEPSGSIKFLDKLTAC